MELSKNNVFLNKIFVWDGEKDLVLFRYETDRPDITRVLVTKTAEITRQNFGDHGYVIPFEWESEEQFNHFAIEALLESCYINNNVVKTVVEARNHFEEIDIPRNHALVSKDFSPSSEVSMELYNYFWEDVFYSDRHLSKIDGLKPNQILFTPEPEFLGVVSVSGENFDKYGIGIINSNGPILVELK
jgi:hypothetical protein